MRLRLAIILIAVSGLKLKSQDGWTRQQLLRALQENLADSTRVDVLNELTWPVYSYNDFDSSIYYGEKAISLAAELKDQKRLCVAHRRIGITYSNFGKLREAVSHEETSYAIADSIHFERGKYLAMNNIGVAYLNSEQLNGALEAFLRCRELADKSGDNNFLSRLNMNIGNIYRRLLQYDNAQKYFLQANHYAKASGHADSRVNALCNLSGAYRVLGKLDSAEICLDEAETLSRGQVDVYARMNLALARGQLLSVRRKHPEALEEFKKAQQLSSGLSDEITLLINIAEQYQWMEKFPMALENYNKALALSEKNKMFDNLEYISRRLGEVYDRQGNYRSYAKAIKNYLVYRDSNEKINKAQEIIARQLAFDFQRKHVADSVRFQQQDDMRNLELQMSHEKLRREKLVKLFLFAGIGLLVALALFISSRLRITRRQKKII